MRSSTCARNCGSLRRLLRLRREIARQEVRRIGLDEQPVERDQRHGRPQLGAAALVADPTRDADVQIELEIGVELLRVRP